MYPFWFVLSWTKCFMCVLLYDFMPFNQNRKLHLLCLVYGFQNNLAPTSGSVLTTSGANINANVGGTPAYFLTCFHNVYTVKYFFFCTVHVCLYLQVMVFRRTCQMVVVSSALESLQVSPQCLQFPLILLKRCHYQAKQLSS